MKYKTLNRTAKYNSFLIRLFEKRLINKWAGSSTKFSPVFIVGAPRTGSTLLYQVLTNYLDVSYIDNLIDLFYRNLYLGFWLSNRIYKNNCHKCFKSIHGNTENCGLHAPNESGRFWYRWFPKNEHYLTENSISTNAKQEILFTIKAILNKYKRPFLFKNLNMGQRLQLVYNVFPNAKIIFIKRDPVYTSQSIIKIKAELAIPADKLWSVKPKNYSQLEKLELIDQVVCQVYYCEKQIYEDLQLFPPHNIFVTNYQNICKDTYKIVKEIMSTFNLKEKISINKNVTFNFNESQFISDSTFALINKKVAEFDWEFYKY